MVKSKKRDGRRKFSKRQDLIKTLSGSKLPIKTIRELKVEAERVCGGAPARPKLGEKVIAAIKWVDGTLIDIVKQVE